MPAPAAPRWTSAVAERSGPTAPMRRVTPAPCCISPGVVVGEYLYSGSGEAKKETDFRCIHLPTGELKWVQKDLPTASVICADGKLLVLTEKGELLLADASPNGFKPLARAQVLGGL